MLKDDSISGDSDFKEEKVAMYLQNMWTSKDQEGSLLYSRIVVAIIRWAKRSNKWETERQERPAPLVSILLL